MEGHQAEVARTLEERCWSRSARAKRLIMSTQRQSPHTARIATPMVVKPCWTKSVRVSRSNLCQILPEFLHQKTSWKAWLELWLEHYKSEQGPACPMTVIPAMTRNQMKNGMTDDLTFHCNTLDKAPEESDGTSWFHRLYGG